MVAGERVEDREGGLETVELKEVEGEPVAEGVREGKGVTEEEGVREGVREVEGESREKVGLADALCVPAPGPTGDEVGDMEGVKESEAVEEGVFESRGESEGVLVLREERDSIRVPD